MSDQVSGITGRPIGRSGPESGTQQAPSIQILYAAATRFRRQRQQPDNSAGPEAHNIRPQRKTAHATLHFNHPYIATLQASLSYESPLCIVRGSGCYL